LPIDLIAYPLLLCHLYGTIIYNIEAMDKSLFLFCDIRSFLKGLKYMKNSYKVINIVLILMLISTAMRQDLCYALRPLLRFDEKQSDAAVEHSPFKVRGIVQNYEWGNTAFIPELLNVSNVDGKPQAELWIGAHPKAPAVANIDGIETNLSDLIYNAAIEMLGEKTARRFSNELPYLSKVLCAAIPLSLQAHPNKEQAISGFERENNLGIDIGDPKRNYKDENHKPEIIIALTDFYALNGFRPLNEIADILKRVPGFNSIMPDFDKKINTVDSKKLIKELYTKIMSMPQEDVDAILKPLIKSLKSSQKAFTKNQHEYWVLKADELYTENENIDRGIFSIYLLNLIHLKPNEAMYLDAGILHAYLEGNGMECMANSDNVLRAGLTPKHQDVKELIKILTFDSGKPDILTGEEISDTELMYHTPAEEFMVSFINVSNGNPHVNTAFHSADALIVLDGEVDIESGSEVLHLKKGEIVIIPAAAGAYIIKGSGRLCKASVPNVKEEATILLAPIKEPQHQL